jgi:glutaryl-CoA dehydrogenase (non-decarboxylating)
MNFELPEEVELLRQNARRFAEERIKPTQEDDEKHHRFRPELVKEMAELGFFGTVIPEDYGGFGMEHGFLAAAVVSMELARISASWSLPVNMQMLGPALTILRFGSEAQKQEYIPKLVAGEYFGCFAITEPNTGSDVASMKTHADPQADGSWLVNGQKTWISNAHVAHCGLLYAYTDTKAEPKHKGMSAFIMEPKNHPGIDSRPIDEKFGLFCSPTGELFFNDAKLPAGALLGARGDGFKICMSQLDGTRLSCSARAVGVGEACIEAAVGYANERKQFGKTLGDFQMIQSQIAEMVAEHEAAKLLVYQAAVKRDRNERASRETSIAKYFAAEAAVHAANETMKIFGSYGFSNEYPCGRLLRDSKSYQVVEGTSNIQKTIIAGYALGKRS